MTVQSYSRLELAERQLKSAVSIFVSGGDRFSAITLSGAADVILSQLVLNSGEENFTDFSLREEFNNSSETPTRAEHGRDINNTLFVNALKHMDKNDEEYLDFDPDRCAIASILKAISNYVQVGRREADFVQGFLYWVRQNLDSKIFNVFGDPNWKSSEAEHE